MSSALSEMKHSRQVAAAICMRGMRRIKARPVLIVPTIVMPVVLVISFTGAFSSLTRIEGYGTSNIYNWMAPYGALQGAVFAGIGAVGSSADDLEQGFFDRLLLTPGSRFPLLMGTVGYSAFRALIPTTAVFFFSLALGMTVPGGIIGVLSLYIATSFLAVVFCLIGLVILYKMKTQRSLMLMQVIAFGALFISVGQVPQSFMDGWLKIAARYNPITNVLELSRQGFLGDVTWSTTWPGLVALASMSFIAGGLAWRGLKKLAP